MDGLLGIADDLIIGMLRSLGLTWVDNHSLKKKSCIHSPTLSAAARAFALAFAPLLFFFFGFFFSDCGLAGSQSSSSAALKR